MRKKCKFLFVLTFAIVFLFYKGDSAAATENAETEQTVSTGTALIEWLEMHKDSGGTVKLADHVVLDGQYSFCPSGINMSSILVDTGQYTITVTGEIELLSDYHLTFSGQPAGNSIFYVAEKGMLSMLGVAVESGQCALWQEEGAGLEVADCRISGSIHYADTPFVMYSNAVCAVVEKGQTVTDVLPSQLYCKVNRQGRISFDEPVPVSWDLEGTETQQEERQRFLLQGSFISAASAEPALCTVAYNDYPLTFTDVETSVSDCLCSFCGGYTVSEEYLPITVMAEYSFDGENWNVCEERTVTKPDAAFYIAFDPEECDPEAHPNVYIRLQGNDNGTGTGYFSNVLCYTADSLEYVSDAGGSRGGGTSITNPPDEPQESVGDADSKAEEPVGNENNNTDPDNTDPGSTGPETSPNTNAGIPNTDPGSTGLEASPDTSAGTSNTDPGSADIEALPDADRTKTGNGGSAPDGLQPQDAAISSTGDVSDTDNSGENETVAVLPAQEEISANLPQITEQSQHADIRQGGPIVIAIVCVLLAVAAGAVGFYAYSRSGTNRYPL